MTRSLGTDTINFLNPIQPFPDWFSVGENLQLWASHKTIGYMAQGSTVYPPGTDLHELKTYITSRLLWNSTLEPLQEIGEFLVMYCKLQPLQYITLDVLFCSLSLSRALSLSLYAIHLSVDAHRR